MQRRSVSYTNNQKYQGNNFRDDFNPSVQSAKRQFKQARRQFTSNLNDANRRLIFIAARRKYKNTVNQIRKFAEEKKVNALAKLEKKNPKQFWKGVKDLVKRKESNNNLSPMDWSNHFSNLLNTHTQNNDKQFLEYVRTALPNIENVSPAIGPLDGDISVNEVDKCIKKLKRGKSHGSDMILNEMLMTPNARLKNSLVHIFNVILKSRNFPDNWSLSYIVPIHKSGSINDVDNYRGVAISSCMCKLFTSTGILNSRLSLYMDDNNLWRRKVS